MHCKIPRIDEYGYLVSIAGILFRFSATGIHKWRLRCTIVTTKLKIVKMRIVLDGSVLCGITDSRHQQPASSHWLDLMITCSNCCARSVCLSEKGYINFYHFSHSYQIHSFVTTFHTQKTRNKMIYEIHSSISEHASLNASLCKKKIIFFFS